jgi:hypothetical protein
MPLAANCFLLLLTCPQCVPEGMPPPARSCNAHDRLPVLAHAEEATLPRVAIQPAIIID